MGVGQLATVSSSRPLDGFAPRSAFPPSIPGDARAVGHAEDEQPLALLARASLRRCEQSSLNRETHAENVSPDPFGAPARQDAANVFDEDEPRTGLDEDAPGRGPQVALVLPSKSFAGEGMRLTRDSANDAIHKAAPWPAVEGSGI